VTPRLFQDADGAPMGFFEAVIGGRSVGVPGMPALMEAAHRRWGRANWQTLFDPAYRHATEGFTVSTRMAMMVQRDAERLSRFPATAGYFLPDDTPISVGALLKNPGYANAMRLLAQEGAAPFYTGAIAREIVSAVQGAADNPGLLDLVDFAIYRVKERPALCAPYRGRQVCGMGPPSSGALAVGQILGLLESYDLARLGFESPEAWRLIGEASRLAFADRGRYVADSDFVPVPVEGMLEPQYLAQRAQLIAGPDALQEVSPGQPEFDHSLLWADHIGLERPSTTHISIVDRYGNALSMTSSVENAFGSRMMVSGFLLNNQLTDFSFRSHADGVPIANRAEPGKRPRSSMSPTIVMDEGAPVLVLGSPGGSRIIPYVAKTIIAHLDWGLDVQQAVSLPHLVNRFGTYDLEEATAAERFAVPLAGMGYEINSSALTSGLHAISITDRLRGGADPRREGIALGQ
ncbi:MAG: gamma-glutamyltransferase family protein, partial [Pseudomonadota bacterium]